MDSTRRTRTRAADRRPPPAPEQPEVPSTPTAAGNHCCPSCQAWIEVSFVDGELVEVVVQHRWMPCRARRDPQPLADWRGDYVNTGIPEHWSAGYNAPPDLRPPPRPASDRRR